MKNKDKRKLLPGEKSVVNELMKDGMSYEDAVKLMDKILGIEC